MNVLRTMPSASRARRTSQRLSMPMSIHSDLDYLDDLQEQETIRAARSGVRRSRMIRDDRYI